MEYPRRKIEAALVSGHTSSVLHVLIACATVLSYMFSSPYMLAADYVLTIGGGYEPAGNQASLEANVLFFQQLIDERFPNTTRHHVFFADGMDDQADLQVITPKTEAASPTIALLESAFALDRPRLSYRNHQVPNVEGPISPKSIRVALDEIAEQLTERDRLLIYVTAHGSPAPTKDSMNTAITCWNKQPLTMKMFSQWLDAIPDRVPIVLVMAQCYCGGFANTIFEGGDVDNGLTRSGRVGFFAQRFDLPAAGCRPDIENDEEYSSYFWGAFMGRSRTGKPAMGVDRDLDGRVTFDEAHAFAIRESHTIDIPLKTSDLFLRHYSRIAGYEATRLSDNTSDINTNEEDEDDAKLDKFIGTLEDIAALGTLNQRSVIESLAMQLGLPIESQVAEVLHLAQLQSDDLKRSRNAIGRRGVNSRRGPRNSGRRDFQREIVESWPDLADPAKWKELSWLSGGEGEIILEQLRQLPSFEAYNRSLEERRRLREKAAEAELKDVVFKRLVHTLESIVLAQNLPRLADDTIVSKYKTMISLESSFLVP